MRVNKLGRCKISGQFYGYVGGELITPEYSFLEFVEIATGEDYINEEQVLRHLGEDKFNELKEEYKLF